MSNQVICQKWEESERGWGVRPDGYSLHTSEEDRNAFIKAYWDRMPDAVPAEYKRPSGTPYLCEVDDDTYQEVVESTRGVRRYSNDWPEGGADGWAHR